MAIKIIKILFILWWVIKCCGDEVPFPLSLTMKPAAAPQTIAEIKSKQFRCNNTMDDSSKANYNNIKLHLPFIDIQVENQRKLIFMQEKQNKHVFAVHGNELYQLFLDNNQEKHLQLIGNLSGSISENQELHLAKVISWHNYLLFVIATEDSLEVYQLRNPTALISDFAKMKRTKIEELYPIQKISFLGSIITHIFLENTEADQIMLIVAVNYTKLEDKLHTFEWMRTYFSPIEDLTIPPIFTLQLIGVKPLYLISGRHISEQFKIILTVYEIQNPGMKLKVIQTLTVVSDAIFATTFRDRNYLITCMSYQKKCKSFRLINKQFKIYKHQMTREFTFDFFSSGANVMVGATTLKKIQIYTSTRMDCFISIASNETKLVSIFTQLNVQQPKKEYILLIYQVNPYRSLLRLLEIELDPGKIHSAINLTDTEDVVGALPSYHRHKFDNSIQKLRSVLLRRRIFMDFFRSTIIGAMVDMNLQNLKTDAPMFIRNGKINEIKVLGQHLLSPVQILRRVQKLRTKTVKLKRIRRSLQQPWKWNNFLKTKYLNVGNLILEPNKSLRRGFFIQQLNTSASPQLNFPSSFVTTINIQATKFNCSTYRFKRQADVEPNVDVPVRGPNKFVVRNLNLKHINNVEWNQFYNTLFLRNRNVEINGRLNIQSDVKVINVWSQFINDHTPIDFFSLKEPQNISTNLVLPGFYAMNLWAETINDINFNEDLIFHNQKDTFIKTPISFQQIEVMGNVLTRNSSFSNITMSAMDFQQTYTEKVIITGNVIINNLLKSNPEQTSVMVKGNNFQEVLSKTKYLLKNSKQHSMQSIRFGQDAKVTAPSLASKFLNNHPTDRHWFNAFNQMLEKMPFLMMVFKHNSRVKGNIVCSTNCKTKIHNLQTNMVVQDKNMVNLTGVKVFKSLKTNDLQTTTLNNLSVNELLKKADLLKEHPLRLQAINYFENIDAKINTRIRYAITLNYTLNNNESFKMLKMNDFHTRLFHTAENLDSLNIVFQNLNDIAAVESALKKITVNDERMFILFKNLIVDGNMEISKNTHLKILNNVNLKNYFESLVNIASDNELVMITGKKNFLEDITLTESLSTSAIDKEHMENIYEKSLLRSTPQTITGIYTFDELNLFNMDLDFINGLPCSAFINSTYDENLIIDGDLILPALNVRRNISSQLFDPNFIYWLTELHNLTKRELTSRISWQKLVVHKKVYCNELFTIATKERTQAESLLYIYKNAVTSDSIQNIDGNIKFINPIFMKMSTNSNTFQGLDLIANDCLMKNNNAMQNVAGSKVLRNLLYLSDIRVENTLSVQQLNDIKVLRLNSSLYRLWPNMNPIVGPLHFLIPPKIDRLEIMGFLNNFKSDKIYNLSNNTLSSPLKMHRLHFNLLHMRDINEMNFFYFIKNRVIKSSEEGLEVFGYLTIQNLVLNKKIYLQAINGININRLLLQKQQNLQSIAGKKNIKGILQLNGPAYILLLNGLDLIERHQNSIFKNQSYTFNNLSIKSIKYKNTLSTSTSTSTSTSLASGNHSTLLKSFYRSKEKEEMMNQQKKINAIHEFDDGGGVVDEWRKKKSMKRNRVLFFDYGINTQRILWVDGKETPPKGTYYYKKKKHLSTSEPERMFEIKELKINPNNPFNFHNTSTLHIHTNISDLNVRLEHFSNLKYRKLKSKITITNKNRIRAFGMKQYVERIKIFKSKTNSTHFHLLLQTCLHQHSNHCTVLILKINKELSTVSHTQSITNGSIKTLRLFQIDNRIILAISITHTDNKQHPMLYVYEFIETTEKFKLLKILHGDYNILEMLSVRHSGILQMLISCSLCQKLQIFELSPNDDQTFKNFQILQLKTLIKKLVTFTLEDDNYLIIYGNNNLNYCHLYKYSYLQGWLQVTEYDCSHKIIMVIL